MPRRFNQMRCIVRHNLTKKTHTKHGTENKFQATSTKKFADVFADHKQVQHCNLLFSSLVFFFFANDYKQTFICSKSTIETLEKGVKYI